MDNCIFRLTPEFSLPESICHAWNFIFDRFFCAKTHLLYDALKDDTSKAYDFLPTPEQISGRLSERLRLGNRHGGFAAFGRFCRRCASCLIPCNRKQGDKAHAG